MDYPKLTRGVILSRYKRFLADIELEDGSVVTAHCPNTGAMTSCWQPGAQVELSPSNNPARKLNWTLERIDMGQGWIGVNTNLTNRIICSFIEKGAIPGISSIDSITREPRYQAKGFPDSRFDLLLHHTNGSKCYVEIKNATLLKDNQILFPDAVSKRGQKHLQLLCHVVDSGHRAIMLYAVNRPEGEIFDVAREIDPEYDRQLKAAIRTGVEVLAVRIKHSQTGVHYGGLMDLSAQLTVS